jgi:hypothetical protein
MLPGHPGDHLGGFFRLSPVIECKRSLGNGSHTFSMTLGVAVRVYQPREVVVGGGDIDGEMQLHSSATSYLLVKKH